MEKGRDLKLQTLSSKSLVPGKEYLLWFLTENPPTQPALLTARIHFTLPPTKKGKEWDHERVEKVLRLKKADGAAQAAHLKSRGAQALLDQRFFDKAYGEGRISSVLSDIRNTSESHGMFITMRTSIPNCHTSPSLLEIQKTHGEPDIVLSASDLKALNARSKGGGADEEKEEESKSLASACYDYLVFVYDEKDPAKAVIRVETGAYNLASVKADADGLQFTDLPTPVMDLRVFYKDRKEIARVMGWGNSGAKVLSGSLPTGTYAGRPDSRGSIEQITVKSPETSEYTWTTSDGKVLRECELKNHAFQGLFKEFYLNGSKRTEAPYEEGKLHGTLRQWDPQGKLVRERRFENGEPVPEK